MPDLNHRPPAWQVDALTTLPQRPGSGKEIVHVITDVCECEIVPVFFFNITCASRLHVKHLSLTCTHNYTYDIINYVRIENESSSYSIYSTLNTIKGRPYCYLSGFFDNYRFWHGD